jgi:phosphate-selective porin
VALRGYGQSRRAAERRVDEAETRTERRDAETMRSSSTSAAALDWYINSQVHFIVNYVYTHLVYVDNTSGNINGLGCRMHVDF